DEVSDLETLAGMLATGFALASKLNEETLNTSDYYFDSNADVSPYRLIYNLSESDIPNVSFNQLGEREFGIWVPSGVPSYYSLFKFYRPAFFQGIVRLCQAFEEDYRN